jgi:protein involved in polysaccharide export with SLBB domain
MTKYEWNVSGCRLALIGLVLFIPASGFGQSRQALEIPDIQQLIRPEAKTEIPSTPSRGVAMDAVLNPEVYNVGPNDVITVNIWSSSPKEHRLTVTPENVLLIPNVGSVDLKGLSLAETKKRVTESVKRYYPNSEVSVSLISPRRVVVQVIGNVINEGTYEMFAVQRTDNLMDEANKARTGQAGKKEYEEQLAFVQRAASQRHITLKRRDGSLHKVDLARYRMTGEDRNNPYLQEGDVVFVPTVKPIERSIGVYGAVVREGTYEFVPGDRLSDLLRLSMGFAPNADSLDVYLSRLSPSGSRIETLHVDIQSIHGGETTDISLRPGDRLIIKRRRELRRDYIVAVDGEVIFPGRYPITRDGTRLSEVIKAAGGVTGRANLRAAYILRGRIAEDVTPEEIEEEQLQSMRASLSLQDSGYYLTETALRLRGEVVSVDFYRLLAQEDTTQDIILLPYDRINIPAKTYTVYVFGQVLAPGHIPLKHDEGVDYYVRKAGGFTGEARQGDVKIIKGRNRVWLDPDETVIDDGDYIWVPKEVHYPFSHYISTYAQIASIIGVVATVALLINTIK